MHLDSFRLNSVSVGSFDPLAFLIGFCSMDILDALSMYYVFLYHIASAKIVLPKKKVLKLIFFFGLNWTFLV